MQKFNALERLLTYLIISCAKLFGCTSVIEQITFNEKNSATAFASKMVPLTLHGNDDFNHDCFC